MKDKTTALGFTLLGFLGVAGLQYFYLRRYGMFIVYLLTMGLFGMGTLIDLFTIGGKVETYNIKIELDTIRANALSRT